MGKIALFHAGHRPLEIANNSFVIYNEPFEVYNEASEVSRKTSELDNKVLRSEKIFFKTAMLVHFAALRLNRPAKV